MTTPIAGNGRGGFAATVPALYLQGEMIRPDLFEEATAPGRGVLRPATGAPASTVVSTLGIIFLSAFVFVTLIAWLEVLRSYIDARVVNEVIYDTARARLYYALAVTLVAGVGVSVMFCLWQRRKRRGVAVLG